MTFTPAVTTAMLEPIVEMVTANIAVIMPIGLTLFGIMVGVGLVPRLISRFIHA